MPKRSSGEIDTPKMGSSHNSDNLKSEIDHDTGDSAHTIKKSLAGRSIDLDEESSDTKDNENVKIQYTEGKSVGQSHLYGSKQVDVEINPGCNITNESSMKIFLQIHRGETFPLVVNCFDTIDYLKIKVHCEKGIPHNMQRIFFGVKELEFDKSLLDYGVHNWATLYLVERQISFIKKRITCLVEISDTDESVDNLKGHIKGYEGFLDPQRIMYAGKQLEDGHSLSDYGIQREATIYYSVTPPEVVKMKIMPETSSGEIDTPKVGEIDRDRGDCAHTIKKSLAGNIAIDGDSSDTKDSHQVKMQYKEGESVLQRHIHGSKQVEVETLGCNIHNIDIFVKTLTGKTIALVLNLFDTLSYLKWKVFLNEGIPLYQQRIIYDGKQLEADRILLDYGMYKQAELHLVMRLGGGGGIISTRKYRITHHVEISSRLESVDSLKEKIGEHESISPAQQMIMYTGQRLEDGHSLTDYGIQGEATVDVSFTRELYDMVIELAEIRSATRNFNKAHLIGEGGSAKVYKGVLDEKEVAIKRLNPESNKSEPKKTKYVETEVAALWVCDHLNIVKIIGYYEDEKELIIVSEYIAGGSLYSRLHDFALVRKNFWRCPCIARSPDDAILDWNARLQIALDIASAMEYLHTEIYFIHRDLKTKNILLDEDLRAKVADFGIVKSQADDDGEVYTKLIGTQGYLCPDYLATGSVGTYSDVYAFGVILLELITGRKALDTTNTLLADWARRLIKDGRHCDLLDPRLVGKVEESELKDVANLATKCVALEKNDRPSMTDIHRELRSMKLGWKN